MYPNPNFNSYLAYQQQAQQMPQSAVQPIQSLNTQPQSQCYFVRSANDLNTVNVMPNTYYLGINTDANEIYVRRMNNDGLIDVKTYSLHSEKKEKTDFQAIFDRLDDIDKKISDISRVREKNNERNVKSVSE